MPAKDLFHDAVKTALTKEGWIITHDPLSLKVGTLDAYIDLRAEKLLAAEKEGEKIAVEIKSFLEKSSLTAYHAALGQFLNYRLALMKTMPERILFLAVPQDTYEEFFTQEWIADSVQFYGLKLVVYNVGEEVIVRWIK